MNKIKWEKKSWVFRQENPSLLPVVPLNKVFVQVQSVVVDLDIYYREILSPIQLTEHLYKPFGLVSMVLNCFYLYKRNKLYTIDDKLLYS